ncbi:MAG: hypothetical protein HYR52_02185 [Candidatus Tectomicrobia bacterium]|nr:hypothetical protein [Candidatus Tectomicrobia bacterium]
MLVQEELEPRFAVGTESLSGWEPPQDQPEDHIQPEERTETVPDLEAWWHATLERDQDMTASASIVIGDEVFPISSIPPENLEVIKLLDEWFSEPDDLGEDVWREIDQMLEEGLSFS